MYKYDMKISRDNKPKFKLQTAYDTLTSRLQGLGYDVDGNIELDTSGYGHGWIKVLRNGRKNNFIYMCSHSDNVDPLCCEPVYRYIKVYNYCDDPKDSNLLGDIPMVVSNINSIPNSTEVYKDDEYKVYKNTPTGIVWGFMNMGDGHVAQAPWTSYPTELKDLSGADIGTDVPYFDIIDNKGYKNSDGTVSAFDDLFEEDNVLYLGKTKEEKTLYTWNQNIDGTVYSDSMYTNVDNTICPYCFSTGYTNSERTECTHCTHETDYNISEKARPIGMLRRLPLVQSANASNYYQSLFNGGQYALTTIEGLRGSSYNLDYQIAVKNIKDNDYEITYCLHRDADTVKTHTSPKGQISYRENIVKRTIIKTLSKTSITEVVDTFNYKNVSNITVKFIAPPTNQLVETVALPKFEWARNSVNQPQYVSVDNTFTTIYLHAYMKDHKDANGTYENIDVHINDGEGEILNYMLHSKTKTYEYSPHHSWNYDEIMQFILYKDENLTIYPTKGGIYHLKSHGYNELKNISEIENLENVLDGNTCLHVGELGDGQIHKDYYVLTDDKKSDISYFEAYQRIKEPFQSRYNYFPNEPTQNMPYWNTPVDGMFEGVYQYHNDALNALPDKYVWLTLNYDDARTHFGVDIKSDPYEAEKYYKYEGNIDTAEIRKPYTDKDYEWKNNFHNFLTNRDVNSIYYKESFSAHDVLSAGSALSYEKSLFTGGGSNPNYEIVFRPGINTDYFQKGADMRIHNNIAWNGTSGYRHLCRTCSGLGMINPFKFQVNNWSSDPYKNASPYFELKDNELLCPTCGRTGVQIRYLYYKHKYVKPLSMYGYSKLNEIPYDTRISNGNQLLLPTDLVDDNLKKDLLLYTTSAAPVRYYAASVFGDRISYYETYLGYGQMYKYTDVKLDENAEPMFITNFNQAYPKWNRLLPAEQNKIKKEWEKQLYRTVEDPDNFVQYYAFRGTDNNVNDGPKDVWSRIFFDKKWIEKQCFENNTLENPNQYRIDEMVLNRGEHNHNHVSQEKHPLNLTDRYYPYYGKNDHHDRNLELDYRKTGVKLEHTCKMCDGTGEVDVYKLDSHGDVIYDIAGNPTIIKDTCPVCNGLGTIEDTHREDYNIAKCTRCDGKGYIVCPKCLGRGYEYKLIDKDYDLVVTNNIPLAQSLDMSHKIYQYISNDKIQFYGYKTEIVARRTQWAPYTLGDEITFGDDVPAVPLANGDNLSDIVQKKDCSNCKPYDGKFEKNHVIPCPECGGAFKYKNPAYNDSTENYYRVAPGNIDTKKLYKYISINAVSIDNISIEMDNG